MIFLTKLISMFLIGMGIVLILRQKLIYRLFSYFKTDNRFYYLGGIRLILGIILILAANQCTRPTILVVVGVIFILSGLFTFLMKKEQVLKIIEWWEGRPGRILHLIGTIQILLGVLIAFSI